MSTKAVLCDLGGVLIDFSFDLAVAEWARLRGVDTEVLRERFMLDQVWEQFEVGRLIEGEFCCHLREAYALALTDKELISGDACWNSIYIGVYVEVEALLREVARQGVRVVGATNTNVSHERVWRDRFAGALDFFGTIYASWEFGARKPDPAFFEHVLQSERLARDEAMFIDDLSENVDAADSLGIDAVLFTCADSLREAFTTRALRESRPSM